MPPARMPRLSSFWECWICRSRSLLSSSILRRPEMSRRTARMLGFPPSMRTLALSSTGTSCPSAWRRAVS